VRFRIGEVKVPGEYPLKLFRYRHDTVLV